MNNQEILSNLEKQHFEGNTKFIYFLLASSGACIAFSLNKAEGSPLGWSLILLGIAVLSWGFSIFFGCLLIKKILALIGENHSEISVQIGTHENQPKSHTEVEAALRAIDKKIGIDTKKASSFTKYQLGLFVGGGIFFIAWEITEIIRTAPW